MTSCGESGGVGTSSAATAGLAVSDAVPSRLPALMNFETSAEMEIWICGLSSLSFQSEVESVPSTSSSRPLVKIF